jgi:hypothetical protein
VIKIIEIGFPFYSRNALVNLMKVYNPKLIEWGVDYLAIWINNKDIENKYAVIDAIQCKNPFGEENKINIVKEHNNAEKIWKEYAKEINCPSSWRHITFGTI